METCNIDDLVKEVRVALDQNMDGKALSMLGDTDTLTLDEIIRSTMVDAATAIEEGAPLEMLEGCDDAVKEGEDYIVSWGKEKKGSDIQAGSVALPSDFLRLVSFKMNDWDCAVSMPTAQETPAYERLQDQYSGIGATPRHPAIAIDVPNNVLEFYCSAKTAKVASFKYVQKPVAKEGKITICPKLRRAIVYANAAMSAAVFSSVDQMQVMTALAYRHAHIQPSEKQ